MARSLDLQTIAQNGHSIRLKRLIQLCVILCSLCCSTAMLHAQVINEEITDQLQKVTISDLQSEIAFWKWLQNKKYPLDERKKVDDKTLESLITKISHPGPASEIISHLNKGIREEKNQTWINSDQSPVPDSTTRLLNRLNLIAKTPYFQTNEWSLTEEDHLQEFKEGDLMTRVSDYIKALGEEGEHFYLPPGGKARILIEVKAGSSGTTSEFEVTVEGTGKGNTASIDIQPVTKSAVTTKETVQEMKVRLNQEYGIQILDQAEAADYTENTNGFANGKDSFQDWTVEELSVLEKSLQKIKDQTDKNWSQVKTTLEKQPFFRIDAFTNLEKNGEYFEFEDKKTHTVIRSIALSSRSFEREAESERRLIHEISHAVINHARYTDIKTISNTIGQQRKQLEQSFLDYQNVIVPKINSTLTAEAKKIAVIDTASKGLGNILTKKIAAIKKFLVSIDSTVIVGNKDINTINDVAQEGVDRETKARDRLITKAMNETDSGKQKMMLAALDTLNELINLHTKIDIAIKSVILETETKNKAHTVIHPATNKILNSTREGLTPALLTNYAAKSIREAGSGTASPSATASEKYNGVEEYWAEGFSLWVAEPEFMKNPIFNNLRGQYESAGYLPVTVKPSSSAPAGGTSRYKNTGDKPTQGGARSLSKPVDAAASSSLPPKDSKKTFQPGYDPRAKPNQAPEPAKKSPTAPPGKSKKPKTKKRP